MIALHPITPENYQAVIDLKVAADQQRFVASNIRSLADAYVFEGAETRAAYGGDKLVGFVMIFPFDMDGQRIVNIVRVMIDESQQGKGYGRALMEATLDWIKGLRPKADKAKINTYPDNRHALALYKKLGFQDAGMEGDEVVLYADLS